MSEYDKRHYQKIKADPVLYAAYLARKRREARAIQRVYKYDTERKRAWRAANPVKAATLRAANHAVEHAIEQGKLVRPEACEACGKIGPVHGHHRSYEKDQWLVVNWLCVYCHAAEHRANPVDSNHGK